jgi:hypothetical protein
MSVCQWCKKPRATDADHSDDDTDPKSHLCWREWNDYSECHEIEEALHRIAPLMRDAIDAWEKWEHHHWEYSNAIAADRVELNVLLEIEAIELRDKAISAMRDIQ